MSVVTEIRIHGEGWLVKEKGMCPECRKISLWKLASRDFTGCSHCGFVAHSGGGDVTEAEFEEWTKFFLGINSTIEMIRRNTRQRLIGEFLK